MCNFKSVRHIQQLIITYYTGHVFKMTSWLCVPYECKTRWKFLHQNVNWDWLHVLVQLKGSAHKWSKSEKWIFWLEHTFYDLNMYSNQTQNFKPLAAFCLSIHGQNIFIHLGFAQSVVHKWSKSTWTTKVVAHKWSKLTWTTCALTIWKIIFCHEKLF